MDVLLRAYDWEAVFSSRYGMGLVSLSYKGKPLLRSPADPAQYGVFPVIYGSPLLLPPNRTDGAAFSYEGVSYRLPMNEPRLGNNMHGGVYMAPFQVLEQSENAVTAQLENTGDLFSFPFRLTVFCCIREDGLDQRFTIENTGPGRMPLTFGLHTNFVAPQVFSVPIGHRWENDARYIPTGRALELTETEKTFRKAGQPQGFPICGFYTAQGHTVCLDELRYSVSSNFDHWVLWNGEGTEGFISIEPQQGNTNCLNNGQGLLHLEPGCKEVYTARFYMHRREL